MTSNNKNRIVYVNFDCFVEVDMAVLPYLADKYEVLWVALQTKGHLRYPSEFLKTFADEHGINFVNYVVDFRNRSPKSLLLYLKIMEQASQYGADLLFNAVTNVLFDFAALRLKIPCVKGIHDFEPHSGNSVMYRLANSLSLRMNRNQLYYSDSQYSKMRLKFPQKNAAMVGFPILDSGKPTVSKTPFSDCVKFLFFGRIEFYKGLDILIDSFERLVATSAQKTMLTICGSGQFWDDCKNKLKTVDRYDLQIRFIDSGEIPNIFSSHHFLVLPYRDATQSGPCSLALNYNIPVIAPRIKCFIDQCPENSSLLYEEGYLDQALNKAVHLSDKEYADICDNWKEVRNNNEDETVALKYMEFFDSIIFR